MFVSGWEKSKKQLISEHNCISCSRWFFSAKRTRIHRSLVLLLYFLRNLQFLMLPSGASLGHFTVHYCSSVCVGARMSVSPAQKDAFCSLFTVMRNPRCHWSISESLACPRGPGVAKARVSLRNVVGAIGSSQENEGTMVKGRGHACVKWGNNVF